MTPPDLDIDARAAGIPTGLPTFFAFAATIVAAAVALASDVVFLNVRIPGPAAYAWYLTTALSFMGAGYGAARWTNAGRGVSLVALTLAGLGYGACDVGLGFVLESLPMNHAILLGAQGLGIALLAGFGGVLRGSRAKWCTGG
jgi:hypothetical protein